MESNVNFKYYAFISYSHEDEEYAKRIQKKLTEYKLPSVIRKANPLLPDNVRPIFRDATNLTTGMLQGTLNSELEHSKFLIVLCSPNSAKPNDENKHWVNKEVQHFIDLGRAEFIIPIIVGGEPHAAKPENECFCPALLALPGGDELLGIDIRKDPKKKLSPGKTIKRKLGIPDEDDLEEKGIVHIVAKMLGLDIDDLWDWNKRAQKRKAYAKLFTAAAVFVIILSVGLSVYFKKIHVYHEYYVDYVDRWGIPEGICKLQKNQIKTMKAHYRFDYQNSKLFQVTHANSYGTPIDVKLKYKDINFLPRPATMKLIYAEKRGDLLKKEYYNSYNLKFCELQKKEDDRFDELYELNTYLYEFDTLDESPLSLEYLIYHRNKEGYITEIKSVQRDFSENENNYDISKIHYTLNKDGTIKELEYFNDTGKATAECGIHKIGFEYDLYGNIISLKNYSEDNELICDKEGIKEYKNEYKNGNLFSETYYDNNSISYDKHGISKICYYYDKHGFLVEQHFLNDKGEPEYCEFGSAIMKSEYDEKGRVISETHYDASGQPIFCNLGFHGIRIKYGNDKFLEQLSLIDINGETIAPEDGIAYREYNFYKNYDYYSYSTILYDKYYEPVKGQTLNYQDRNNPNTILTSYLNILGIPDNQGYDILLDVHLESLSSIITEKKEYSNGNLRSVAYLDEYGNPMLDEYGIGFIQNYYVDGNLYEQDFFDKEKYSERKPVYVGDDKVYKIKFKYDEKRNMLQKNCYTKDGLISYFYEYDDMGNKIKESYTDKNQKNDIICEYDKYGMILNKSIFIDNIIKYSERNYYDEKHSIIRMEIYNKNIGNYSLIKKYNTSGQLIEEAFYDANNKLVNYFQGIYAKKVSKYDNRNNLTKQIFYDNTDSVCFSNKYEYDDKNHCILISFLDANDELVESEDYSSVHNTYDENGRIINMEFFDKKNKLTLNQNHIAGYSRKYEKNKVIEYFFDTERRPVNNDEGICYSIAQYENNKISEISFFDSNMESVNYKEFSKIKMFELEPYNNICIIFDERGNIIDSFLIQYGITKQLEKINETESIIVEYNYKKGVIDKNGNKIIPFEYESIYYDESDSVYECENEYGEEFLFDISGKKIILSN